MLLGQQMVRLVGVYCIFMVLQLIPFIVLDSGYKTVRIIITVITLCVCAIISFKPTPFQAHYSLFISASSILINIIGYMSLLAFEPTKSQDITNNLHSSSSSSSSLYNSQLVYSYFRNDEQTIDQLSINLRYFFGLLNGINFLPGINKVHRAASLFISVILWTFQEGGVLPRLISVSFLIEVGLLVYQIYLIEKIFNDKMSDKNNTSEIGGMNLLQQSHHSHQVSIKTNGIKLGGMQYNKSLSTSRKKWKIEDIIYERDQLYDIVKKFATFNMVIYGADMKMKFLTQNFKNNITSQLSRFGLGLDDEESLKKIFLKINISEQENLFDHIKKTMEQWYGEGQINSSFEMLCNRDRIYSLSNCQINLEKYQLYISEIQFDMQPCIVILFNAQEDVSTFNQYKHKMINSISHDLKTPLNGMILLLDILKEQIKKNFLKPSEVIQPPSLVTPLPSANFIKQNTLQTQQQNCNKNNMTSTCITTKQTSNYDQTLTKLDQSLPTAKNLKNGEIYLQNSSSQKYDILQQQTQESMQIGLKNNQITNITPESNLNLQKYSLSVCLPEEQPFGAALNMLQRSISQETNLKEIQQYHQQVEQLQQSSQQHQITQIPSSQSNQFQQSQQNQFLQPSQNQMLSSQYNHHSKSQIYKYEPTMSTSLIPLQEEEENDGDDQDGAQKESQTDEEWLVQSSIKAATHNHLYHNNFNNFTDKQFFKFQSNISPSSSSLMKKDEQKEFDLKLQQLKLDTLLFRKKSFSDIKYPHPTNHSNQNLQDESLHIFNSVSSKNKVKIPAICFNSPHNNPGILSENHPFMLESPKNNTTQNCCTEQTFQLNSVGKKYDNVQLIVTTVNDESSQLFQKIDPINQSELSPDFGQIVQKQKRQQIKPPMTKLQLQKSDEKSKSSLPKSQQTIEENIQIQENDDTHNFVKQIAVSHNHLQAITSKEFYNSNMMIQDSIQTFNQASKVSNKMTSSPCKNNTTSENIQNIFNFQESTIIQSQDNIQQLNNQPNSNYTPSLNPHLTNQSPSSTKTLLFKSQQKQQQFSKDSNSAHKHPQQDSNQTLYQQEQMVKLSSCSLQNKQIPIETTPFTLSNNNTNNINNFQSTLTSNKQTSVPNSSSPSSILQNQIKQQSSTQQINSQYKIIQKNSASTPSSQNQTPNNQDLSLNLPSDQNQKARSSSNETIPSNPNSKQNLPTPKSGFSQFRFPEIVSRKEINVIQNSSIEPFSKQPKDFIKFDILYDKDRISEIEEKSLEGDQQSPTQTNLILHEQQESNLHIIKEDLKPINFTSNQISNKVIQKRSPPSMNRIYYHSNTAGSLSSSNIPFNCDVSQRSFTYAFNSDERRQNYNKQNYFKKGSKDISSNITPKRIDQNTIVKSSNQNVFTNTTLRDIRILYQYICNIEKNGYLLESRINDLIDYSTLLNKNDLSLNCTQFDLMEIFLEMKDIFELQAKKKNCKLIIPSVKLNLKNDKPRIKQILINIIGNAIKFTFEGFIRIMVQVCESSSNLIQITVQDTGIGIPDNIKKNILNFTAHIHQVKDDNRQGVGIGLEICSRLCQIIGPLDQEISIESKVNIGSSFSFFVYLNHPLYMEERDLSSNHIRHKKKRSNKIKSQISLKSEQEHENDIQIPMFETKHSLLTKQNTLSNNIPQTQMNPKETFLETPDIHGLSKQMESSTSILMKKNLNLSDETKETVLIVDDVAFNLIALRNTLKLIFPNLNIIEAQNGKQAVEKVHENNGKLDLVIMDINMPIMDGFQAMSIINQEIRDRILEYVPIIAHTAFDNNEDKQKCFQLGAKGFLPKPVKKNELEKSVRPFLASQQTN